MSLTNKPRKAVVTACFAVLLAGLLIWVICKSKNNEGMTPLLLAAHGGDLAQTQQCLARGSNVNEQSRYGWTALMFASWKGHRVIVEYLLNAGADPNIISQGVPPAFETTLGHPPTTALRETLHEKNITLANILLDHGAKLDAEAIALAGGTGNIELLERIKKTGADFNQPSKSFLWATALICAVNKHEFESVKWLLNNGADPDFVAVSSTALGRAAYNDDVGMVEYLLEHGANPNLIFRDQVTTALYSAATKYTHDNKYNENIIVIKTLLSHSANPTIKYSKNDKTALELVKIQYANGKKYLKPDMDEELRKRHLASGAHKEKIIELLEASEAAR